ncbi:MAG TPA: UDP-N-acetylglucosamine pyrophosphorylase [Polyangia bacterium]|nr:UDP-N-acetylglucosamine pyrophosphorylase [Polyangia bacterium]
MPTAPVQALLDRGVRVIDPGQIFVAADVDPTRIDPTATLFPGARLQGRRTFLGAGAEVGTEGPATLVDSVLGERASIASGYAKGAVLLRGASLGGAAHVREGTLLEEEASTAHAVGLKQTILLGFVTLGSLINFCDVLMAGGTSRKDHSEVGSGFIHFNFTPWGKSGDKATASLVGDAIDGVFLREKRIFLGGSAGLVGPRAVGYGSITGAGQVVRRDVPSGRLVVQPAPAVDDPLDGARDERVEAVAHKNVLYIANLHALRAWYRAVRLGRARAAGATALAVIYEEALRNLDLCLAERLTRLASYLAERGRALSELPPPEVPPCPLAVDAAPEVDHVKWVQGLRAAEVERARGWLDDIARAVVTGLHAG